MEAQGWSRSLLTVSTARANGLGLLAVLPAAAAFAAWFILRNGVTMLTEVSVIEIILIAVLFAGLIFVHEGLRGVTWAIFAPKHFKEVEFGFSRQQLMPYCWCGAPLTGRQYLLGSLMPLAVLGVIPCMAACLVCWPAWLWLG